MHPCSPVGALENINHGLTEERRVVRGGLAPQSGESEEPRNEAVLRGIPA